MARFQNMYAIVLALLFSSIWAQQLSGSQMDVGYPGLSTSCANALNTSVSCPMFLSPLSVSGAVLAIEEVTALCVDSCHTSLVNVRATIEGACQASTDVIVYNDVAYPATFIADNFLYTYNLSCRKDSATGEFCDPQILSWQNETFLTSAQNCSDCWLGGLAQQLSSPLGYDEGLASNLASLTSSCSANNYAFTSPTAYALNSTATTLPPTVTATPPPTCTGSYVVQAADDCNSVARALSVSTFNLLYQNNLDLYCKNFAATVGTSLCIPAKCNTYTWQALDSCNSVVSNFTGMTVPQFLAWNPNFNSLCQNGLNYVGYTVCLSPPGGYVNYTSSGNVSIPTSASVAVPAPTNAMDGSNRNCGSWYTVQSGDDCAHVSIKNGLSLQDFYFLNQEIFVNCTNLLLGVAYCVEPVGNIATYSGYPVTSVLITVPPPTFTSVNTAIPTSTANPGYTYTMSLLPKASGTIQGCSTYDNYNATSDTNGCSTVASLYGVSSDQLLAWNPSLSSDLSTCAFQPGFSYCVVQALGAQNVTGTPGYCLPINATEPGTASDCGCFTRVHGYQNTTYTCQRMETDFGISLSQLLSWNTWMGSSCDTSLYANLDYYGIRAICIGLGGSTPTSTTSASPTTTTSPIGPTPTDTVPGCQQFYTVQSGDGCQSIFDKFSITLSQFFSWNPAVGSQCTNLWLGEAYCVKGPISTSTSVTATPTGPTGPTQSGIAANCNKWYTVVSGDSCDKVETTYSITFATFLQWNPAIGSDCQFLGIGNSYCVGVSS